MHPFHAIVLGLVEGITEFLPISSTGHLLLTEHFLKIFPSDAFNILIQVGPIIAVTLVFYKDILNLIVKIGHKEERDQVIKLGACFFLTGALGLLLKKLGLSLPDTVLPIAIATLIGGIVIFWAEARIRTKKLSDTITWPVVIAVACGQIVAGVFPGTSRSGAAIIAALLLGIARPSAVRFAFLVGIPTMFAAGALELKEAISSGQVAELTAASSLIAFGVATATAWATVIWLIKYVQKETFIPFAWYRLALGCFMIGMVALGFYQ